eukprot:scaffold161143_cov23-Cyclotella_meneghiniana.AAC.2
MGVNDLRRNFKPREEEQAESPGVSRSCHSTMALISPLIIGCIIALCALILGLLLLPMDMNPLHHISRDILSTDPADKWN